MGLSWPHILIVVVIFVLLFGRGKISDLMGDVAKGIKSFKQGLSDDDEPVDPRSARAAPQTLEHQAAPPPPPPSRAKSAAGKSAGKTAAKSKTAKASSGTARSRKSG